METKEMMVAEEAIDHVEKCIGYFRTAARSMKETTILREEFEDRAAALETAKAALEKQVAKKPEPVNGYEGKCRSCGAVFLDRLTNYCGNCGQALDWSGENDGEQ